MSFPCLVMHIKGTDNYYVSFPNAPWVVTCVEGMTPSEAYSQIDELITGLQLAKERIAEMEMR